MMTKPNQFTSDIEPARRQLEAWRRTRKHKQDRIPEALWSAMAQVARIHGVSRVARALRVHYYALRDRAETALPSKVMPPQARFVELLPPLPTAPPACVVELEHRSGSKMTLRLAAADGADASALIEAFWRQGA